MQPSPGARTAAAEGSRAPGYKGVDTHCVDLHRLSLPLQCNMPLGFYGDALAEAGARVLGDQDRVPELLRLRLQPGGDVDGVADARVGRTVLRPRVPGHDFAGRDSDPDPDLHLPLGCLLRVEEADQLDHPAGGANGPQRVILARNRSPENGHQAVA